MGDKMHNFAAGPSNIDDEILNQIKKDIINYNDSDISILELSHRSDEFLKLINETKMMFKQLLKINDDYDILFLSGGATFNFTLIPLNLLKKKSIYLVSGLFSKIAFEHCTNVGNCESIHIDDYNNFDNENLINDYEDYDYFYYCKNNTVYGTNLSELQISGCPVICDMTSCLMSEQINVNKYDLIFASTQKNLGVSGLSVVIINKKLLKDSNLNDCLNYYRIAKANSIINTCNVFAIYVCYLYLKWIDKKGGIKYFDQYNKSKAERLYNYLDNSDFYFNDVSKNTRSMTNIVFSTNNEELDDDLINYARLNDIINIKGHKTYKGLRISNYNSISIKAINDLIDCLECFKQMKIKDDA